VKNQPVRGILQVKDSATDGQAFDDALNQAQLSLVVTNPGTLALEPADVASVAGRAIRYAFAQRQRFRSIPTAGFLIDGAAFVDGAASVDVTRQNAYDLGPTAAIASGKPHRTDLAQDGAEVAWRIGAVNALRLLRDDSVARLSRRPSIGSIQQRAAADLQKGCASTPQMAESMSASPGKIARLAGGLGSRRRVTHAGRRRRWFAPPSRDRDDSSPGNAAFLGPLAGQASILAAINKAATVGGVDLRVGLREHTGGTVPAGNNAAGGGFFDFTAPGLVFFDETNVPSTRNTFVFVNGVMERNGEAATPHDLRLGTTPASGDPSSATDPPGDVIVP
jgi:hypothetical protein